MSSAVTAASTPTTKRNAGYEQRWEESYNALVEYQKQNGHPNIPKTQGVLGEWVANQRTCYKNTLCFDDGRQEKLHPRRGIMTQDRIVKLEAIGFIWDMHSEQWDEKYRELIEYHKVNGHCNVPRRRGDSLPDWVHTQRKDYKSYKEGGETSEKKTNPEVMERRIQRLEELGFQWKVIEEWETRFQDLLQYKQEHGHCNVNTLSGGPLGNWVGTQRKQYAAAKKAGVGAKEDGKQRLSSLSTTLSDERINRLEDIGFQWRFFEMPEWETRYQELAEYKEEHGDCLVPQSSGELGEWVSRQRQSYKNLRDYRPGRVISQERIDRLNEIDFVWQVNIVPDWDTMYSTLQEFHEKNGHCHLAKNRKRLFRWTHHQRYQYARYRQDLPSHMDKKRERKLNRLDFEWDSDVAEWKALFEEVKVYVDEHGLESFLDDNGAMIKSRDSIKLCEWVTVQRGLYETNELTSEQVTSLNDIGFSWTSNIHI